MFLELPLEIWPYSTNNTWKSVTFCVFFFFFVIVDISKIWRRVCEWRGNNYCQDFPNFDRCLWLCHSNQHHLNKVGPGSLLSLALKWCLQHYKPFVKWSFGFPFKLHSTSYSGRRPQACHIHSPPKKYEFRWIKPLVSHFQRSRLNISRP